MKRATAFVFVGLIILALVIAMSVYTEIGRAHV